MYYGYMTTPQEKLIQAAAEAHLARAKSLKMDDQRKADYYQGMADAFTFALAWAGTLSFDDASEAVLERLEALEA